MPLFPIGRKARDRRDLETAKKSGGSVIIRSKNKIANPENPGQTLGRGSTVTIRKTPTLIAERPTKTPGKSRVVHVKTISGSRFKPGDFQGGKVHDRSTTMALGASMGEAPEKTQRRIDAQTAGQTEYKTRSGKSEYSGRTEPVTEYKTTTMNTSPRMKLGPVKLGSKTDVSVKAVSPQDTKKSSGGGSRGLVIHRSAGTNRRGQPQNYTSLEVGGKKLVKFRRKTPGTGRSQSLRRY